MYFHVIGIKEKNGKKYDLDMLLQGGGEDFLRGFLSSRGVVIVSIGEYKDDPKSFGNIIFTVPYKDTEVNLLLSGDKLEDRVYFVMSLGLKPVVANYVDDPILDDQMDEMITSTQLKIDEEDNKIKQKKEIADLEEQKKYEESGIKDGLKIINENINYIEQLIKAGEGILSGREIKQLQDFLNDMKKIRLGTNFNKMATIVLDAHVLIKDAESQVFNAYDSKKFLIDENGYATNIDVLSEHFKSRRIYEKSKLQPASLTTTETMSNMIGGSSIFLNLLGRDFSLSFKDSSFDDLFDITINLIEYIVLVSIIVISVLWLGASLLGNNNFSLYLLPAMGWLGLLLYLFNNLKLSGIVIRLVGFIVLVLVYRRGLILLLGTFSL